MIAAGNPMLTFTASESAQLLRDVGRSDIAAIGFVEDVRACMHAFETRPAAAYPVACPTKSQRICRQSYTLRRSCAARCTVC
jgi:hypothetical protein